MIGLFFSWAVNSAYESRFFEWKVTYLYLICTCFYETLTGIEILLSVLESKPITSLNSILLFLLIYNSVGIGISGN